MNPSRVQHMSAILPWWRVALLFCLSDGVQIGGVAAVDPMAGDLLQIAMLLQVMKCPLHGGAGQLHVGGDGVNPRPAFALGIGAIPQVHINCLSPRGQFGVCINGSEVTHCSSSPKVFMPLEVRLRPLCVPPWTAGGRLQSKSTRLA